MTTIKRKEKKGLFYLIAIAIMVAIMGISCSESPTTPANLSESGTGGGTDGGGAGIGGGTGTDGGYKVDVIYQEVAESLKNNQGIDINNAKESDLDNIWKALVNDGNKQLYVTSSQVCKGVDSLKRGENGVYFSFDREGNMIYYNPNMNPGDINKKIKVFQKAVLVKVNGGYVIGGLYKVGNLNFAGIPQPGVKRMIQDQHIGFTLTEGDYEVVFVNPQIAAYAGGKSYGLYGSSSSTKNEDFSQVVKLEDYTGQLQLRNGIGNSIFSRFYR